MLLGRGAHCAGCSSSFAPEPVAVAAFGCRQPLQRAPRRILFRVLLGASHAAGQRLSRLSIAALEPNLDQKSLAVVGAAFTLDPVNRRAGPRRLQMLLKRRFVVAQRRAGAQLLGQLLGRLAHHLAAAKALTGSSPPSRNSAPSLLPWYWKARCSCAAGRRGPRRG